MLAAKAQEERATLRAPSRSHDRSMYGGSRGRGRVLFYILQSSAVMVVSTAQVLGSPSASVAFLLPRLPERLLPFSFPGLWYIWLVALVGILLLEVLLAGEVGGALYCPTVADGTM